MNIQQRAIHLNFTDRYPIAVDIGDRHVYALQLEQTGEVPAVREVFHREINWNQGEGHKRSALVAALRDISRSGRFKGKRVILHLPPGDVSIFPLRFQASETETLEEAILRESAKNFTFPIEEAIIDYPSITTVPPGNDRQYKAMVIAVRKQDVTEHLSLIREAGLSVEVLESGVSALIRLHQHLHDVGKQPAILCHIGDTNSILIIFTRDAILAQRHIAWGIRGVVDRVRTNFNLGEDGDKALTLLKECGLLYGDRERGEGQGDVAPVAMQRAIFQIISPHIDELIYEILKMISYVRAEEGITGFEGVYLYGQAVLINRLGHYFEQRIDVASSSVNPLKRVRFSQEVAFPGASEGSSFDLALGLAMRKLSWL